MPLRHEVQSEPGIAPDATGGACALRSVRAINQGRKCDGCGYGCHIFSEEHPMRSMRVTDLMISWQAVAGKREAATRAPLLMMSQCTTISDDECHCGTRFNRNLALLQTQLEARAR